MMQRIKDKRAAGEGGFTLIELLVVIIILGILAAVVVFAVGGVGDKGQSAACKIDTRTLRTGLEANYAQLGNYVVPVSDYNGAGPAPRTVASAAQEQTLVTNGFLSEPSTMHNYQVYDANLGAGTTPAIEVIIQDTKCGGAVGDVTNGTTIF